MINVMVGTMVKAAKKAERKRGEQFVFLPGKEQAKEVRKLVKERQKSGDEHTSQGSVLRDLIQRGLRALDRDPDSVPCPLDRMRITIAGPRGSGRSNVLKVVSDSLSKYGFQVESFDDGVCVFSSVKDTVSRSGFLHIMRVETIQTKRV